MHPPARRFRTTMASVALASLLAQQFLPAVSAAQSGGTSNVQRGQECSGRERYFEARAMIELGVDGIISDYPDRLAQVVKGG